MLIAASEDSIRAQIFDFNETIHQRHPAEPTLGVCVCMCLSIGHASEYYSKAWSIVRGHRSTTDSLTACECLGGPLKGLSWRQMFFFGLSLQGVFRTLLTTITHLCSFEFAMCVGVWICVHVVRETFSLYCCIKEQLLSFLHLVLVLFISVCLSLSLTLIALFTVTAIYFAM